MGVAVVRIAVVMGVHAGFLFAVTLHFQGGLGYSALRAGLSFAPTAVVFGAVGLTWRRRPRSWQRRLVPGGFLLSAVSALASGWVLRDGQAGGPAMYVAFAALGAGLSLAFSPVLTGALSSVRQGDAADASGLLATVTQRGRLIGVATFGTLLLSV
jgi:hypothetical protein